MTAMRVTTIAADDMNAVIPTTTMQCGHFSVGLPGSSHQIAFLYFAASKATL